MTIFQRIIFISLVFILSGCHPAKTDDSLMYHPHQLQAAYARCQQENSAACDNIQRMAENFTALMTDRVNHPELFGEKILQAQIQLAHLKQNTAAEAYQTQLQQVRVMLAVVAATTGRSD